MTKAPSGRSDTSKGSVLSSEHLTRDLGRRTASGGVIALCAQALILLTQVGYMALMARLLQPDDFGLVAMAASVTAFVGVFADLGLSMVTVQRKEVDHDTVSALFFVNLGVGFGLMPLAWLMAPVATWLFNDPRVFHLVLILAIAIPITAAGAQHKALLIRHMRWMSLHSVNLGSLVCGCAVGVAMAWGWHFEYWSLAGATLTTALVGTTGQWVLSPWRPTRVANWRNARSAISFGINYSGSQFTNYINRQSDNVLVGWKSGPNELGFYTRAYSLFMLPMTLISGPIGSVIIPMLSRLQTQPDKWARTYLSAMRLTLMINTILCILITINAQEIVEIVYGENWSKSGTILAILSLSLITSISGQFGGWALISLGRARELFVFSIFSSLIRFALFLFAIQWGAPGVAVAWCITSWVFTPVLWLYATRGTELRFKDLVKASSLFFFAYIAIVALFILGESVGTSFNALSMLTEGGLVLKTISTMLIYGAFVVAPYRFAGSMWEDMRLFLDKDVHPEDLKH
ncbi:lipopolysaccharide biosynthesis protein [Mesorhizobium sp.]|uniref:lipopolysaccharide biosynthesis protein n=1 Tax=Mesorhizobium sp. TaxID=1871066 RepID=UPI000FEA0048|nr:lipopolysaccharide biosynthesis protein [Mesorhizobium sp.]RWP52018.1 MAG: lipopolysaccharide biosynthesis protein [Mesorhizobium sp.]